MSARPEPRASNLSRRVHPAIPAEARVASVAASSDEPEPSKNDKAQPERAQVNVRVDKKLVMQVKARLALQDRKLQDLIGDLMQEWITAENEGRRKPPA